LRTDRYGNTSGQDCQAKGSGKEAKVQDSVYTERERERETSVEHEMYDYTGNN